MKGLNDYYQNIQDYFDHGQKESKILTNLRSVLLILFGVASTISINQFISGSNTSGTIFLLLAPLIFYFYSRINNLLVEKEEKFPIKLLDNLKAVEELDRTTKDLIRKNNIDDYLDNSITALNLNTCDIEYNTDPKICSQGLKNGLKSVLNDYVERPNYILNTDNLKFSVGLYLRNIMVEKKEYEPDFIFKPNSRFIKLRDDIGINEHLNFKLNEPINSKDISFALHTVFSDTYQHNKMKTKCIDIDEIGNTIIASPIQAVCESSEPIGIMYVIINDQIEIEGDLENINQIFGRIVSNWIDKYNECIINKYDKLRYKELGIPEEIIERDIQWKQNCISGCEDEIIDLDEETQRIVDQAISNN